MIGGPPTGSRGIDLTATRAGKDFPAGCKSSQQSLRKATCPTRRVPGLSVMYLDGGDLVQKKGNKEIKKETRQSATAHNRVMSRLKIFASVR